MRQGRFAGITLVILVLILALGVAIVGLGLRIQRAELANGELWRTDLGNEEGLDDQPPASALPSPAGTSEGGISRLGTCWKYALFSGSAASNE
ncbi:MAG: hypothetical protein Q4E13_10215 [Clostridia bacterium]|nr:hypothetical protein [Clostridia bacterium]